MRLTDDDWAALKAASDDVPLLEGPGVLATEFARVVTEGDGSVTHDDLVQLMSWLCSMNVPTSVTMEAILDLSLLCASVEFVS